jgi:hypothetical protein
MYLDTIKTVKRIIPCYDCEISPTLPEEPGASSLFHPMVCQFDVTYRDLTFLQIGRE